MAKYSLQHLESEVSLSFLADVYDREGYEVEAENDKEARKLFLELQDQDDKKALEVVESLNGHDSNEAYKEYEGAPSYSNHIHRLDDEEEDWVKVEY